MNRRSEYDQGKVAMVVLVEGLLKFEVWIVWALVKKQGQHISTCMPIFHDQSSWTPLARA